jgi:hypothetical protein
MDCLRLAQANTTVGVGMASASADRVIILLGCLVLLITRCSSMLLIGVPSDYEQLFPQGNEYRQAQVLFSKTTRLNATDYFMDTTECLTNHPKPLVCAKFANKYHREFSRLWQPKAQTFDPYPRRERDCQYRAENFTVVQSDLVATLFAYDIRQHSCELASHIRGGAALEIFAVADSGLGSCSYTDHLDDTYRVTCSVPAVPAAQGAKHLPSRVCANVTTLLMYEHFDGFSEILLDWSHLNPPLRAIITDNLQFCADMSSESQTDVHMQPFGIRVPQSVQWFTGLWFRVDSAMAVPGDAKYILAHHMEQIRSVSTAQSNLGYAADPASSTSAFLYHSFLRYERNFSALTNISRQTIPQLAMRNPRDAGDKYIYRPLLLIHGGKLPTLHPASTKGKSDYRTQSYCLSQFWDPAVCKLQWNNSADASRVTWDSGLVEPRKSHNREVGHHLTAVDERSFMRNFTYGWYTPPLKVNATTALHANASANASTVTHDKMHSQSILVRGDVTHVSHRRLNPTTSQSHHQSPQQHGHSSHGKRPGHAITTPELERMRMQYHFVGASHMRYIFDSICEYFLGMETLRDVPRKHDELKLANLQYNFIANARHQVAFLSKMCAGLQNDTHSPEATVREQTHTLIFQTGAWDLSVASLRRVLEDPNVAKRLMALFDGILSGRHPCGKIKRVLWLTSVPHAVCYDDNAVDCNAHRSYRVNVAVSAVNHFYLQLLFRTTHSIENDPELHGRSGARLPRLAVVDAFNIIKPRLVFDEVGEVVCTNHFTCRYTRPQNYNFSEGYPSVLVHSPGGMALVKTVMTALAL